MSTIRFTVVAVGLFVLAFVGISWANKALPMMTTKAAPMRPDARIPTFEESVKKGITSISAMRRLGATTTPTASKPGAT